MDDKRIDEQNVVSEIITPGPTAEMQDVEVDDHTEDPSMHDSSTLRIAPADKESGDDAIKSDECISLSGCTIVKEETGTSTKLYIEGEWRSPTNVILCCESVSYKIETTTTILCLVLNKTTIQKKSAGAFFP